MFKVTRIVHNGKDQPTSGLYKVIKPTSQQPYWQLLYHNPNRTIYLSGNVKIVTQEQRPATQPICETNQMVGENQIIQVALLDGQNPYNYLRKKGV